MQIADYSSIWEIYGLRTDPFSTNPLLVFGGEIPLSTFMGRTEELKRLNNLLRNKGGSRVVVSGDVGVGKTSFVNYARAMAQEHGKFFTTIKEIAIQPDWTAIDFVMSTMGAILTTSERNRDITLPDKIKKKLDALVSISEIKNVSISASAFGFGGGGGRSITRTIPPMLTMPLLQELFEDIINAIQENGFRELILHYNNLELFEHSDLIRLFNGVRDFVQTRNVHFIFVGGLTIPQSIQSLPRVASIFSDSPIILPNLGLDEVRSVIAKRINSLAIKKFNPEVPVDENVVKTLYELYNGNLRHILNSLSTAFKSITEEVPVNLTLPKLKRTLYEVAKKIWLDKLTKVEQDVLFTILQNNEITNKDISKLMKKHPQNISKVTNKLLEICAIRIRRQEKREKYFAVEPSLRWLLFEKQEPEKISEKSLQKNLSLFLNVRKK